MPRFETGVVGYEVVDPLRLTDPKTGKEKVTYQSISGRFSMKDAAEQFRSLALPAHPECYIREIRRTQKMDN